MTFAPNATARNPSCVGAIALVTGPQAAGKTTVSALLAALFERGVHLDGDVFRRRGMADRELRELFENGTPRIGTWIDTSVMTEQETADRLLEGH